MKKRQPKQRSTTDLLYWAFLPYVLMSCKLADPFTKKTLCRIIANVQLLSWLCLSYDWWISMSSCWTLWFSSFRSSTDYLKHLHMMKKLRSSCWIKTKKRVSASRRAEGILLFFCHTSETEESFKCASVMLHLAASEVPHSTWNKNSHIYETRLIPGITHSANEVWYQIRNVKNHFHKEPEWNCQIKDSFFSHIEFEACTMNRAQHTEASFLLSEHQRSHDSGSVWGVGGCI